MLHPLQYTCNVNYSKKVKYTNTHINIYTHIKVCVCMYMYIRINLQCVFEYRCCKALNRQEAPLSNLY